jgi:hypothetical protein
VTQTPEEIAWRTLAAVSKPTVSTGAGQADTLVSWRLWWTSLQVYPYPPTYKPPVDGNTNGAFRPIPCQLQSENAVTGAAQPADYCEVIWLNGASVGYVLTNKFWIRENVIAAAKQSTVSFPDTPGNMAVEMKTEWQEGTGGDAGTYVTAIDTNQSQRRLVAFHMMIRGFPKWLWATFIHEDSASLVTQAGATFEDHFGSHNGKPTRRLLDLLAGEQMDVLSHYRLIGTQTDFDSPKLLGNPLIEPADMIKKGKISCVTCHTFATIDDYGRISPQPHVEPGIPHIDPSFYSLNFNFTLAERVKCINLGVCSNQLQ